MPEIHSQHGNVLLLSLVLLAAITLLGTTAMQGAIQEERIASNQIERHLASEGAQSALAFAQNTLQNSGGLITGTSNTQIANLPNGNPAPRPDDWQNTVNTNYIGRLSTWNTSGIQTQSQTVSPEYMIELFSQQSLGTDGDTTVEQADLSGISYYRLYGRGLGRDPAIAAVAETVIMENN